MAKVMKANGELADAYAEFDLGSELTAFWATFPVEFKQDTLDAIAADGGGVDLFRGITAALAQSGDNVLASGTLAPTPPVIWEPDDITVEIEASTAYLVECNRNGTTYEFYVDGVLIRSATVPATGPRYLRLGTINYHLTPMVAYYGYFKVGTTRGGTELADVEFTDGTLDGWTTTSGDVSVVDDPFTGPVLWTVEHYEHEFTAVTVGMPEIEENGDLASKVAPENLHFLWQLAELGPSEIDYEISLNALDLDTDLPVVSLDFIRPYFHDWTLKRGTQTLLAGLITSLNIQAGSEHIKVAGKDWLHYLERRNWPYDADLSYINWPDGFRFKVSAAEIGQIVTDMLETVRDVSGNFPGPPNDATFPSYSLKFVVDCDDTGTNRNYEISAFETTNIYDLVRSLSQMDKSDGGFDFYMTPDRPPDTTFRLVYPEIGDPDTPIYTLEIDEPTALANMLELGYTDSGPEASHVLGVGAGTANRAGGVNKHLRIVSARTRRLDKVGDYGDVKNLPILESKALADLQRAWRSIHEIPILVDPADIPGFWDVTQPGKYVMVDYDLFGHRIDSVQKIVSMDVNVDLEGNERVLFGLNQLVEGGATDVASDP